MIEIFPASKVLVDSLNGREKLLVCVRGEKGSLLFITELEKYLKAQGRGRRTARPLKTRQKSPKGWMEHDATPGRHPGNCLMNSGRGFDVRSGAAGRVVVCSKSHAIHIGSSPKRF